MNATTISLEIDRWKWRNQFILNLFTSIAFIALGCGLLITNYENGAIHSSKLLIGLGAIFLGLPSAIIIWHLFRIRNIVPMFIETGMFTDRTRLGRPAKNIPLDTVESVDIVYRSRPFAGISREYKVIYHRPGKREADEAFLADYLVSRKDLEWFVETLQRGAGIEEEDK